MNRIFTFAIVFFMTLCLFGMEFNISKAPILDQKFNGAGHKDVDGYWCGADGVYSIKLDGDRYLWIFGDTLWGNIIGEKRSKCMFLNNTIGIEENSKFKFYKGLGNKNYFKLDRKDKWFWPLHGTFSNEKVYAAFVEIERKHNIVDDPLGFRECGNYFSIVKNTHKNPLFWNRAYSQIPYSYFKKGSSLIWGGYILKQGEYTYIFGLRQIGMEKDLVVARVHKKYQITDYPEWEFYTSVHWSKKSDKIIPIHKRIGSEYSITYHKKLKRFLLIYSECYPFPSKMISAFSGKNPCGPFEHRLFQYEVDEILPDSKHFTYSGKNHPHLQSESEIVISYVINSFVFSDLWNDSTLYFPRFLKIKISK
ncbi:DUF4185 domain-containing protein [bacterium]|nr:DUF4185 domain-containing protein [bacterium]